MSWKDRFNEFFTGISKPSNSRHIDVSDSYFDRLTYEKFLEMSPAELNVLKKMDPSTYNLYSNMGKTQYNPEENIMWGLRPKSRKPRRKVSRKKSIKKYRKVSSRKKSQKSRRNKPRKSRR